MRGPAPARYSSGGDDHIFVELDVEMNLAASLRVLAITSALRDRQLEGITDICPGNVSYQVRFDPLTLDRATLLAELSRLERMAGDGTRVEFPTSVVEVPVYYDDPWSRETMMRFRPYHQDPSSTDLEFVARLNGLRSVAELISLHSGAAWFTSMVGFAAGLPFLFQLVPRNRQLEAPKYPRPRTDTPVRTVGHGGCFSAIYGVRGAGGYQILGMTPAPIYDPAQQHPGFADDVVLFGPGTIVVFRPIGPGAYEEVRAEVTARCFSHRRCEIRFSLPDFLADPDGYNRWLLAELHAA